MRVINEQDFLVAIFEFFVFQREASWKAVQRQREKNTILKINLGYRKLASKENPSLCQLFEVILPVLIIIQHDFVVTAFVGSQREASWKIV